MEKDHAPEGELENAIPIPRAMKTIPPPWMFRVKEDSEEGLGEEKHRAGIDSEGVDKDLEETANER